MRPVLLALDDVAKSFGSLAAVDGVTLALGRGEALGIIGPNGAGKTTLFSLIAGDLRADRGRILLDGRDVTGARAHVRSRRGIARTFQIPHPFAKMTVFENLLVATAFGRGRKERACYRACMALLDEAGLGPRANAPAGALTLLERKRLELARALALEPRVLLLDEIAGGLTEPECQGLVETVRRIVARGVALVWIEHVIHAVTSVVARLVVMDFGRVIAEGTPGAVMAEPAVREVYLGIDPDEAP